MHPIYLKSSHKHTVTWGAVLCTSVRLFSLLSRSTVDLVSDWAAFVGWPSAISHSIALSASLSLPLPSSHTPSPFPVGPWVCGSALCCCPALSLFVAIIHFGRDLPGWA